MDDVAILMAIERIKRLKGKYQRCVDSKDWEGLAECFTEDATAAYDSGKYSFSPGAKIVEFLRDSLGSSQVVSLHQVHTPEIDVLSENEARGIWYLQDYVINLEANTTLVGAGFYHDEYVRQEGEWKIRHTGYERTFEQWEDRGEHPSLKVRHRFG